MRANKNEKVFNEVYFCTNFMKTASVNGAFREYKYLNIPELEKEVRAQWAKNDVFKKSIEIRKGEHFVFYEGPPSANGLPGIHHVLSRAIKDIFCRYKSQKGYKVERKGGWDTHGLPIELQVEKSLGITKEDIGNKISIEDYNAKCRQDVLKFKSVWDDLTQQMGYWVDLENPYITYENDYIQTLWYLLKELHKKGLLYKGYTVQPYSPAAGTGLSSHELNQPGTYKDVKDTTVTAQFKLLNTSALKQDSHWGNVFALAWTTTPWTLPSNTALAVGANIIYCLVKTYNQYTGQKIQVILAKDLLSKFFTSNDAENENYQAGNKELPFEVIQEIKGKELLGIKYEQLIPWVQPEGKAFEIIEGDYVSTEDGTGIVHIAPSFGADDARVAQQNGIDSLTLVDKSGRFTENAGSFAGKYVKNYQDEDENAPGYKSTDVLLSIMLKEQNKAFKVEKYVHSYPHCWRTDKPILYYPLESWFIKTTAVKDQLINNNKKINWKPKSTGEGRFGNWLENLVDWNLSRSRYWGTPLPIWRTEDGLEEICIGSIEELQNEIDKAVEEGFMKENLFRKEHFDLHRPFIDEVILCSPKGKKMFREPDLIDVWFDSGAMPYAQLGYPFNNKEKIDQQMEFPADFIAEGVDQTRGWFFTLHAIATLLFDSVAFKNVVANGLVLDKNGQKMSKRLGNSVDPFEMMNKYGADVVRWYMVGASAPWDNLKFDETILAETRRKFFGTLINTYNFFAIYANIDGFNYKENFVTIDKRQEADLWILSKLNSLIIIVQDALDNYNPTTAIRAIDSFLQDELSNWYIRLNRRRFWKTEKGDQDKLAAYCTLFECLEKLSLLMVPFSPFYADRLYQDLNNTEESVHLQDFPSVEKERISEILEQKMSLAQDLTSLILSVRKKEGIKVRQPLQKVVIPFLNIKQKEHILSIQDLVLNETNIKELELISSESDFVKKSVAPNFKVLGPKVGKDMKILTSAIKDLSPEKVVELERKQKLIINAAHKEYEIELEDVNIMIDEVPGWEFASKGSLLLALDINVTEELELEGLSREIVNKIQNLRKEKEFNVADNIEINLFTLENKIITAIEMHKQYICKEVLASNINIVKDVPNDSESIETNEHHIQVTVKKI